MNQIYQVIKNGIMKKRNKTITLNELYSIAKGSNMISSVDLSDPEGIQVFQNAVNELIGDAIIESIGKSQNSFFELPGKFKILNEEDREVQRLKDGIVKLIIPPATKTYYLKNIDDFKQDQKIIGEIIAFLKKDHQDTVVATVNERSYELFTDEKLLIGRGLSGEDGRKVMMRLGLTYENLYCKETLEPFFSFQNRTFQGQKENVIFIIENKDTFWTFKEELLDQKTTLDVNMLIYGEGRKILSSFQFMENYVTNIESQKYFYFGDLDAEGINIFIELGVRYPECNILPFKEAYQAIYEIGNSKQIFKTLKTQNIVEKHIDKFVEFFEEPLRREIKMLLFQRLYVPQEALSLAEIRNGGLKWEK